MDDKERRVASMSTMATGHLVLQAAIGVTIGEARSACRLLEWAVSNIGQGREAWRERLFAT